MVKTHHADWVDYALEALSDAGYQKGGARSAVVNCLAHQSCAVTAQEIEDQLRADAATASRASIYRALEQLERLELVHRLDVGTGTASYEVSEPSGDHHHHMVCAGCGRIVPFEDPGLERTIGHLAGRVSFDISEHDVVLRGLCPRCVGAAG
jgi:Fur family transcriptional regulator, ferric uptake regulator